jgi:DNA (cytosine-5)-methyltransferase 1
MIINCIGAAFMVVLERRMMGSFNYECEGQMSIFDILNSPKPRFKIDKPVRLIELFSGIGSQAMALRDIGANFEHYRSIEFDKYAISSYNAIHGTEFPTMDVTEISGDDLGIVDKDKYCYILTYSFPCTDISLAGQMQGFAKGSGTRSSLLWEVERLLNEVKELPQVLLMENVSAINNKTNMPHFQKWIEFLESKGYSNYWQNLNSKDYGVAQSRNRCFMVSLLGNFSYEFPKPIPLTKTMKDYLEPEVDDKYYLTSDKAKILIDKLIKGGKILTDERTNERTKPCCDLEVGGQRGIVYQTDGILPCESATQYKDPTKILELKT